MFLMKPRSKIEEILLVKRRSDLCSADQQLVLLEDSKLIRRWNRHDSELYNHTAAHYTEQFSGYLDSVKVNREKDVGEDGDIEEDAPTDDKEEGFRHYPIPVSAVTKDKNNAQTANEALPGRAIPRVRYVAFERCQPLPRPPRIFVLELL